MSRLTLNQLELLVAVVDSGSFSAAATTLDCTQSRISHAIAELEQVVGTRLLQRTRSGCTPTAAGQQVLLKARQILRIAAGIIPSVQADTRLSGIVRIACYRSIGTHLLPYVLEALAIDHPGIQIEIDDSSNDSRDVNQRMHGGQADIGISSYDIPDGLISKPYIYDMFSLILPTALRYTTPVTWAQLAPLQYIQADTAASQRVLAQCHLAGYPIVASRQMTSDSSILALVRQGLGYSILPRLAAFPTPPGVTTEVLPVHLQRPFLLILHPDTARQKVVQTVVRYLRDKQIIRQTEAWRHGVIGFNY